MKNINSINDLVDYLDIDVKYFNHILYDLKDNQKYKYFEIPKKSGGVRNIYAPIPVLKIIQSKISEYLYSVYKPTKASHGFCLQRDILTNAKQHFNKRIIYNLDLKDFFPSINSQRIFGLFKKIPFNLDTKTASVLTKICTFNNFLPQGSPTSPVLTNFICRKLDHRLIHLARKHYCYYTRYADDITISSTRYKMPNNLIQQTKTIILEEGFKVNNNKERLENHYRRQEVTGLIVNTKPNVSRKYIRNIKSVLHNWGLDGLEFTSIRYSVNHNINMVNSITGKINFIGYIRGKNDKIYLYLLNKLQALKKRDL